MTDIDPGIAAKTWWKKSTWGASFSPYKINAGKGKGKGSKGMDKGEESTRLCQILGPQKRAQTKRRGKKGTILQAGPTSCPNQFQ